MSNRIGLALSGGGFRATAFGLGSLRALHDLDMLRRVSVVSSVSGGSLLAAMWAYGPKDFQEFDAEVVALLRAGLQAELARRAFTPRAFARSTAGAARSVASRHGRRFSRTDALVEALLARPFGARPLQQVTHAGLETVFCATDLTLGNAMRFGSAVSASSQYGAVTNQITVAEAVAASAAFPVLLPALTREYEFLRRDGTRRTETLILTDGGVYENLGVAALMPLRSREHSIHTYELDQIIAVDAGRGRMSVRRPRFATGRLARSFDVTHTRSQNAARAAIHSARESGAIDSLVHVYLGMQDQRVPTPIADLVPLAKVRTYGTNFAAMASADVGAIAVRGEQITRALVGAYSAQ